MDILKIEYIRTYHLVNKVRTLRDHKRHLLNTVITPNKKNSLKPRQLQEDCKSYDAPHKFATVSLSVKPLKYSQSRAAAFLTRDISINTSDH